MGRDSELADLRRLVDEGRPVAVVGEAGVGKTTLVRAAALEAGWSLAEAGGLATLSWHAYLPFRRLLGHELRGDPAFVATRVEGAVGDAVLFLDDAQWADRETLAAIPFLVGRARLLAGVRRGDPGTQDALAELATAGFSLLHLEPLRHEHAVMLVRVLRPGISETAAIRLVERTGGNPLLIEELVASGAPSESLQLALGARVRALSAEGREAMGLLALAGRPLEITALGRGAGELIGAGLAHRDGDELTARHAVLAEAALAEFVPDERRRLHLRLAEEVRDPGEAARHFAAAGERRRALEQALAAVERAASPGERALHLELAASAAIGPEADGLRLQAASALTEAARFEAAAAVLERLATPTPDAKARSHLLQAQAAIETSDLATARRHVDEGLGVDGASAATEIALLVEHVSLDLEGQSGGGGAVGRARALVERAEAGGHQTAAARATLARALWRAGDPAWESELLEAIASSRLEGSVGIELRSAEAYLVGSLQSGRPRAAQRQASAFAARADELRLAGWERRFRMRGAWLLLHAGRFAAAFDESEALLDEALEDWERYMVVYCAAQSAADLGFHERAAALVADLLHHASGPVRLAQANWARADAAFWAGRPADAVRFAGDAIEGFALAGRPFVRVTRAWARHEAGLDPTDDERETTLPVLEAVGPELDAVALLAAGRYDEAAGRFHEAGRLWRHRHARGRLRCAWAEGESLRLAGREDESRLALLRAELLAEVHRHGPLLARSRRSLRLAGERRSAGRGDARNGVTPREREILGLVADGLTNAEIARRLGLGRPTVERLVQSASRKLGATTRAQAAAMAAGE